MVEAAEGLRILQVNTEDRGGGAANVAWGLFRGYRARGHEAWMAVGRRRFQDPNVFELPNEQSRNWWARLGREQSRRLFSSSARGAWRLGKTMGLLSEPLRELERFCGREDFDFPATRKLLELTPNPPDVLHCHNLHGGYFDLRMLPALSNMLPLVWTLHDAWAVSGHCAHSFDCDRWQTGCGKCPDLGIPPSIPRDGTAYNWRRKGDIYGRSRVFVVTPSRWLMEKVERSMLRPLASRVIPYGIDLAVFRPGNREEARRQLKLPADALILVFAVAGEARTKVWRDYHTLEAAIRTVSTRYYDRRVIFLCLGSAEKTEMIGNAEARFIPYQHDQTIVATYYRAADIYVHAAKADTFPNVILEALACGTPVVASAVGGIPEQVEDGITGFLAAAGDPGAMANCIDQVFKDEILRRRMSAAAADSAHRRFDLNRQVDQYLKVYGEAITSHQLIDQKKGMNSTEVRINAS